jgi:hypothetical protein
MVATTGTSGASRMTLFLRRIEVIVLIRSGYPSPEATEFQRWRCPGFQPPPLFVFGQAD